MRKSNRLAEWRRHRRLFSCIFLLAMFTLPLAAAEPPQREIFVPETELGAIFEAARDRVVMPRNEFEAMLRRAREIRLETKTDRPPVGPVLLAAEYAVDIVDQRAVVTGTLDVDLLTDEPVALPLDFNRVSLLEAVEIVDETERPAALGSPPNETTKMLLILEKQGRHRIRLRMTTPLEVDSTRQRLAFRVPRGPNTTLRLSVPGDVELKHGASVVSRKVDGGATRFELLLPPSDGEIELLLTLNSHRAGSYSAVLARSVQFAEVTEQYDRLHATMTLGERHQGLRDISFEIPEGFEMTDVRSLLLDRWNVRKVAGKRDLLEIRLREQQPGLTTIRLSAIKMTTKTDKKPNEPWRFPVFEPVGAASNSVVLGLLVDTDLEIFDVRAQHLFPIDTMTLKDAIPATALDALPGSPSIRLALAWYRSQNDGRVEATFRRPEANVAVETRQALRLSENHPEFEFYGTLKPRTGRIFEAVIEAPAGDAWKILSVTDDKDRPLEFRQRDERKIAVRLPHGIGPGEIFRLRFRAVGTVPDWFEEKDEKTLPYPVFRIEGVEAETGVIFVRYDGEEDREIVPAKLEKLTVLDEKQLGQTAPGIEAGLALQYRESPYSLELSLKKIEPRVTAKIFGFYRFAPKLLAVRYEIEYSVEQARTRTLAFTLPGDAPPTPNIRGLGEVQIRETFSEAVENEESLPLKRRTVRLARPMSGKLRLAVEFEQPIEETLYEKGESEITLPRLVAENTAWQSGVTAIEGDEELDITMPPEKTVADRPILRPVDAGVLGSTEYKPGNRLLGVFTVFDQPITVGIRKNTGKELPTAVVRNVFVTARLEPPGRSTGTLYAVSYELRFGGGALKVELGEADELWSVTLDGETMKPRNAGGGILIPVPARSDDLRQLTLLYRRTEPMENALAFPILKSVGKSQDVPIPVMQTTWSVEPPVGYEIVRLGDTPVKRTPPEPALFRLYRYGIGTVAALTWRPRFGGIGCSSGEPLYLSSRAVPGTPYVGDEWAYTGGVEVSDLGDLKVESERFGGTVAETSTEFIHALPAVDESAKMEAKPGWDELSKRRTKEHEVARRGRRLQSAQPVTVVVSQEDSSRMENRSAVGDRDVREMTVRLASLDHARRLGRIACLLTVLAATAGLGWTRRRKAQFVFGLMLLGTVTLFLSNSIAVAAISNGVVYGAALGGLLYVADTLRRLLFHRQTVTVLVLLCLTATTVHAEDEKEGPRVTLPGDAVIVPYSMENVAANKLPGVDELTRPGQTLLVPMDRHRKLLELFQQYETLQGRTKPAPLPYTVSSARYEAAVGSDTDEELTLTGKLAIDVFAVNPVLVPLVMQGGVMLEPRLDGKPASLQSQSPTVSLLLVEGAGSHELTFTVKLKIRRQGGWRIVDGKLPVASGTVIRLRFPEGAGDFLTNNPLDKRKWELTKEREIETTPAPDGNFLWQWRTAVSGADVDRNLEVESVVRLDVQEDGCWVRWTPTLRIGRGRWEIFRLNLPGDYVIVDISGENVRGWTVAPESPEGMKAVDIELLKPAEKQETLTVQLMQAARQEPDGSQRWTLPKLSIPEAGIHRGRIDLYRSASRSLDVGDFVGLSPTDMPAATPTASTSFDSASPLGMLPFQSYRFVSEQHGMTVRSRPVTEKRTVNSETVLKISRRDFLVESKLRLTGSDKPFCGVVKLPENFALGSVETPPGVFWNRDGHRLNISCGDGFSGPSEILLDGRLEINGNENALPVLETLPRFEVEFPEIAEENIERKTSMAVLTEPSLDVRAENLERCRALSPDRVFGWLQAPEQRELVRLALEGEKQFNARLVLSERKPEIRCSTITNIRTTAEAVEETTLLDFTITRAGVRTLEFQLVDRPEDITIEAPMLRRKTVDSAVVRLELQDDVIGQYRVLVRSDRRLYPETDYRVSVPMIRTGQAVRQYVVMENDRRSPDEMVVDPTKLVNLRALNRQQNQWQYLASMLGGNVTEAYCVDRPENAGANLRFRMRRREAVRMAAARIDLAETRLLLGENGSYRAEQVYRIDNKREPYLDLVLPEGAELWGVRILSAEQWNRRKQGAAEPGRPVKPCAMPDTVLAGYDAKGKAPERFVRIPLVKTESGDLDYVVRLVYAGDVRKLRGLSKLDMPFVTVLNVPVGQSLVRLHLPDGYEYRFDGNLQPIESHREQEAVDRAESHYYRQQEDRLRQAMSSENPYAVNRARKSRSMLSPVFSSVTKTDTFRYSGEMPDTERGISKAGEGSQVLHGKGQMFYKGKATQIDYPDAEIPTDTSFSSNTVTIEKQFQSQSNRRSNDAVSQKALSLSQNGGVLNDTPAFNGANAGFDQNWLDQSNLNYSVDVPFAVGGGVEMSSQLMPLETNVPQTNRPAPQGQQYQPQPYPDGRIVAYAPMIAPGPQSTGQTEIMRRRMPRSQAPQQSDLSSSRPGQVAQLGRPGQTAQLGRPLIDPPQSQSQMSRNVEIRGGNIVLDNRTQTQSEGLRPGEEEYLLSGRRGDTSGNAAGMGGGGGMSSQHFRAPAPISVPVPAALPAAPVVPTPFAEAKPVEESSGGRPVVTGLPLAGSGDAVFYGGSTVGGVTVTEDGKMHVSGKDVSPEPALQSGLSTRSASLDIEIPVSGRSYLFTTPQGALELSVRPISSRLGTEAMRLGAALLGLALLYGMYRLCLVIGRRWRFDRRTHRSLAALVTLLGALALLVAPLVFLLSMTVAGILWSTLLRRKESTEPGR